MTPDIAELRRLEREATAGPWVVTVSYSDPVAHRCGLETEDFVPLTTIAECAEGDPSDYFTEADAVFIRDIRNAAPALFDEVESQAARIAALEKCLRECAEGMDGMIDHRYPSWGQRGDEAVCRADAMRPVLEARALLGGE